MNDKFKEVGLVIPMLPEMELTATQTAEAVGTFMKLDEEKIEEVKIALIEACINAFEHSKSPDGRISINFEIGNDELIVYMSDQGHGFDLEAVRQELDKRRAEGGRRGWGLKIMEELMDDVEVLSNTMGTTIKMVKRR